MAAVDAERVALLVARALAASAGATPSDVAPREAVDQWLRRIEHPDHWALVRRAGGAIVGVCHGSPEIDVNHEPVPRVAHLTGLFVEPQAWGRGHGRALLRAGMERMAALGAVAARLWTAATNERANRLYASEGWTPTGRRQTGLDGQQEEELVVALGRPGFGTRHPDVERLIASHGPSVEEAITWPGGRGLIMRAYAQPDIDLPDELVTSVRCITRTPSGLVVCRTPSDDHLWPGGRREAGETFERTACREVHEETGWIVDPPSLTYLGFLHGELRDPQPPDHPWPHPDFFQLVYTGFAATHDGDDGWADTEGWETESWVVPFDEIDPSSLSATHGPFLARLPPEHRSRGRGGSY